MIAEGDADGLGIKKKAYKIEITTIFIMTRFNIPLISLVL
jgi:hypothetical protein